MNLFLVPACPEASTRMNRRARSLSSAPPLSSLPLRRRRGGTRNKGTIKIDPAKRAGRSSGL
jgi:hypothetical protein